MAEAVISVEKFRRSFYEDLKKEDIAVENVKSDSETIDLYHRKKSSEDPWLHCFCMNDTESNRSVEYSNLLASSKNLTYDQIIDLISKCSGITDVELNRCKAAMRREVRSRNLTDLSLDAEKLQSVYLVHKKKFHQDIEEQKILSHQIKLNMKNFKDSLNDCLCTLEPLTKITTTSNTSMDVVTTNFTKIKCTLEEFKTHANLVVENIFEAMEKFERYETFDEKMDSDLFILISRFFPNFLVPRTVRIKGNATLMTWNYFLLAFYEDYTG